MAPAMLRLRVRAWRSLRLSVRMKVMATEGGHFGLFTSATWKGYLRTHSRLLATSRTTSAARLRLEAAASPSPVAGATAAALGICLADGSLRETLSRNAAYLRSGLRALGLDVADLPTPIICLPIGNGDNMARIQKGLMDAGIAVAHSRNYAGVDEEGALRIAVFATHTPAMIDELIEALRGLL